MSGPTKDQLQKSLDEMREKYQAINRGLRAMGLDRYQVEAIGESGLTEAEEATNPSNQATPMTMEMVRDIEARFSALRDVLRPLKQKDDSDYGKDKCDELYSMERKILHEYYEPMIEETKKKLVKVLHEADAAGEPLPSPMTPVRLYQWFVGVRKLDLQAMFVIIETQGECVEAVLRDAATNFRKEIAFREKQAWLAEIFAKRGVTNPTPEEVEKATEQYHEATETDDMEDAA